MSLILSITTVIVTLISPVIAVQVQKFIERYTDKKTLKIDIFKQLMATRSQNARLSNEHVRALNMIDIAFYGRVKKVTYYLRGSHIFHISIHLIQAMIMLA